jgi:hypothetical protein
MTEWRKSSRSGPLDNTDCVELAQLPGNIGVRDSKNPTLGHLILEPGRFAALVRRIKTNTLDL